MTRKMHDMAVDPGQPIEAKVEEKILIDFKDLLGTVEKIDFEDKIGVLVAASDNPEILAMEDVPELKRVLTNAALTFRENMQRFVKDEAAYKYAVESVKDDAPDTSKAVEVMAAKMQKYVNKMCMYASKVTSVKERLGQIAPEELQPKRKGPKPTATVETQPE